MVEYGLVTWYLTLKEMTYRQMLPLTTGLELEKYSPDNRQRLNLLMNPILAMARYIKVL